MLQLAHWTLPAPELASENLRALEQIANDACAPALDALDAAARHDGCYMTKRGTHIWFRVITEQESLEPIRSLVEEAFGEHTADFEMVTVDDVLNSDHSAWRACITQVTGIALEVHRTDLLVNQQAFLLAIDGHERPGGYSISPDLRDSLDTFLADRSQAYGAIGDKAAFWIDANTKPPGLSISEPVHWLFHLILGVDWHSGRGDAQALAKHIGINV